MLRLEPIIARFVDQILSAIRASSLDDLRELLPGAAATRIARAPEARRPARSPAPRRAVTAAPVARVEAPVARPATPVGRVAAPARKARDTGARRSAGDLTEITDPEKLLNLVLRPAPAPVMAAAPPREIAILSDEAPASSERPTAAARARLRAGESLARETGNGVVIRRAKRA